jgi:hydroxymethylpyrimidine/phosphomethylpyrimidine kinase
VTPFTALTIAGSDSGGGAGVQADLKAFLGCGIHGMSAITAVTVQNSLGVSRVYELPPAAVAEQIESVVADIGVDAVKTGMLANGPIIEAVAEVITRLDVTPLVVDPVAASQHGDPLLAPEALDVMRKLLFPLATLVTPNIGEIRLLTGIDVESDSDAREAARALYELGPRYVLVKGGHRDGPESVDVLFDGSEFIDFASPRHATVHTHGTGDTLASATCAALACGLPMVDAVRSGKDYVTRAVIDSFPLGAGRGPVGHFWTLDASRSRR